MGEPVVSSLPRQAAVIDAPADVAGFRREGRRLLAAGVAPDDVDWVVRDDTEVGLFTAPDAGSSAPPEAGGAPAGPAVVVKVPPAFVQLTTWASLHQDAQRFDLLYRLLWRLQHEPALRGDPLDPQWLRAEQMAHAVRRDLHKMKAFVRFRPIDRGPDLPPLHVAWFEPEHHVVEAVAPFFAERFAQLQWTVLTPRRSMSWDGERLCFGPGAKRDEAPAADAGEALWLTYYGHIFNPARLKLAMMRKEMPRRYWKNLPEAALIEPLAASAHQRSAAMIDQAPTVPARVVRSPVASYGEASEQPLGDATAPLPAALPADASDTARLEAWTATRRAAAVCTRCPLHAGATQTVFGAGPMRPALMFVGEQPGDQEDLRGAPFVGPAGQLFGRALTELKVARDKVYVTNAVKHFKYELRGTRRIHKTPAQQEAAVCLDWLEREIALVQPRAIVALGATAARSLLGRPIPVTRERGNWLVRNDAARVLITLHPSALLRMDPSERDAAYAAWLADLRIAIAAVAVA